MSTFTRIERIERYIDFAVEVPTVPAEVAKMFRAAEAECQALGGRVDVDDWCIVTVTDTHLVFTIKVTVPERAAHVRFNGGAAIADVIAGATDGTLTVDV
jgi:hypothetical protein